MSAGLIAALLATFLMLATALQMARLMQRWRVGRSATVAWRSGLLVLPKRYLVDVHHIVGRDPYAALMHALAAGGLIGGTGLMLGGFVITWPLFWLLPMMAFATALAGGAMVARRRLPSPNPRLSRGRFQILPWLLIAYGVGALLLSGAAAIGAAGLWPALLAGAGGIGLLLQLGAGPLRHALAGTVHLIAHRRPARFDQGRDVALRTLDLASARLGLETPRDFTWPTLAGIDACVQCGRCEAACPALAAGMPLNPKKLIQDIAACLAPNGSDAAYTGSPHPGRPIGQGRGDPDRAIIGADAMIHPDTLWSCTTCRACVEECPMMIEHVDAIIGLRRFETLERGAVPEKAAAALAELRYGDDAEGRPLATRTDFAVGLTLAVAAEGVAFDILLWLGDGAFDLRYGRTLRALIGLMQRAGLDVAVLGPAERDCGDLARRLGDEATFQRLTRDNIATLRHYRFRRIVTADPHVFNVLKNEYPAFGGTYEIVHHTSLLAELVATGRLVLTSGTTARVTYHDPCYLGRYNGEVAAPRALLRAIGVELVEMERSGLRAMCCGAGGGSAISDVAGERRIPDLRMAQAAATGAAIVAVACPNCTAMLEGVTGQRPEVQDVAELLLAALEPA